MMQNPNEIVRRGFLSRVKMFKVENRSNFITYGSQHKVKSKRILDLNSKII